jgi:hypothetical protein
MKSALTTIILRTAARIAKADAPTDAIAPSWPYVGTLRLAIPVHPDGFSRFAVLRDYRANEQKRSDGSKK